LSSRRVWVRVGKVGAFYVFAAALFLPVLDGFQSLLRLPPMFGTLMRGGLVIGWIVALAVAVRYPEMGDPPSGDEAG